MENQSLTQKLYISEKTYTGGLRCQYKLLEQDIVLHNLKRMIDKSYKIILSGARFI